MKIELSFPYDQITFRSLSTWVKIAGDLERHFRLFTRVRRSPPWVVNDIRHVVPSGVFAFLRHTKVHCESWKKGNSLSRQVFRRIESLYFRTDGVIGSRLVLVRLLEGIDAFWAPLMTSPLVYYSCLINGFSRILHFPGCIFFFTGDGLLGTSSMFSNYNKTLACH